MFYIYIIITVAILAQVLIYWFFPCCKLIHVLDMPLIAMMSRYMPSGIFGGSMPEHIDPLVNAGVFTPDMSLRGTSPIFAVHNIHPHPHGRPIAVHFASPPFRTHTGYVSSGSTHTRRNDQNSSTYSGRNVHTRGSRDKCRRRACIKLGHPNHGGYCSEWCRLEKCPVEIISHGNRRCCCRTMIDSNPNGYCLDHASHCMLRSCGKRKYPNSEHSCCSRECGSMKCINPTCSNPRMRKRHHRDRHYSHRDRLCYECAVHLG